MHANALQLLCYERDKKGKIILRPRRIDGTKKLMRNAHGKVLLFPVPTWVAPVGKGFATAEALTSNEQRMWREAAALACLDALGLSKPLRKSRKPENNRNEHIRTMAEAQDWFRYDEDSVETVFMLAGVNYESTVGAVLKIIGERELFNG